MNTHQQLVLQAESLKNSSAANAAILLENFTDHQLFEIVRALADGAPYPALWDDPPAFAVRPLIAATINTELWRRWQVDSLESEP